jgi:hypothetical protein
VGVELVCGCGRVVEMVRVGVGFLTIDELGAESEPGTGAEEGL